MFDCRDYKICAFPEATLVTKQSSDLVKRTAGNSPPLIYRSTRARQDPAAERLRFHHGDAQEGGGLHQEAAHPQHARGQKGRHPDVARQSLDLSHVVRPLSHQNLHFCTPVFVFLIYMYISVFWIRNDLNTDLDPAF